MPTCPYPSTSRPPEPSSPRSYPARTAMTGRVPVLRIGKLRRWRCFTSPRIGAPAPAQPPDMALELWERGSYSDKYGPQILSHGLTLAGQKPSQRPCGDEHCCQNKNRITA